MTTLPGESSGTRREADGQKVGGCAGTAVAARVNKEVLDLQKAVQTEISIGNFFRVQKLSFATNWRLHVKDLTRSLPLLMFSLLLRIG